MEAVLVPFHFISTFFVAVAAAAGFWVALRRPEFAPKTPPWRRWSFLAGWLLLSLGEISHGSRVFPSEVDQGPAALRAGAYAFLTLALLAQRRTPRDETDAGAVAVLAQGSNASLSFMPIVLAAVASIFAFRSRLSGSRRLALALGLMTLSEILFGLGGASSDAPVGFAWFAAHALRLAGGFAIGYWLWEAFRTSVQIRFVAAFLALSLLVVATLAGAMTQVFATNVRSDALEQSAVRGKAQQEALNRQRDEIIRLSHLTAGLPSTQDDVSKQRRPELENRARAYQSPGGLFEQLDFVAFLGPVGEILALSDAGPRGTSNLGGDDRIALAGTSVVQAALTDRIEAGSIDAIGESKLAVIAAAPVFNPPGVDPPGAPQGLAGAVTLGVLIDRSFLETFSGDDLAFSSITRDRVIASTLIRRSLPIVDPTDLLDADLRPVFERGEIANAEGVLGQAPYFSAYVPLQRPDGVVVGALVVSRPSEVLDLTQRNVGSTLFIFSLVIILIAIASSYVTGSRVTRPIRSLTGAAQKVREGDLSARAAVESADEVGVLGETFNEMVVSIGSLTGDLQLAATQLDTILQSLTDGVVAVDSGGKIVAFNREAERILGVTAGRAQGKAVAEVLTAADQSGNRINLPVYDLHAGSVTNAFVTRDGASAKTPVAITSAPIRSEEGVVTGAVAVVRDLSSELALEKAKTEFLSNISHELNTPLTPIMGWANMLRSRKMPRRQATAAAEGILGSGQRLKRIVDMLIDVSSMEAGRLTIKREPLDLNRVTAAIVDRRKAEERKHRLARSGFRGMPQVEVDPRLVPRAIDELVDNAIKFSPKGGRVSIAAEIETSGEGSRLRVSVSDQGIGISKDQIAGVFAEFTQVDASETRAYGGLGLGLSYVRRVVEAHGGKMEVASSVGKGSRFTMIIPLGSRRVRTPRSRTAPLRRSSTPRRRGPIKKKGR